MQRLPRFVSTAMVMFAVSVLPVKTFAQTPRVDLTGKWLFSVTTDLGTGTPTVTLKQQGDSLTGHYSSQTLGEADLKGSVKENKFNFIFTVEVQGTVLTVTYSGTVENIDFLKGTVDLGGAASGTFTAKRGT